MGDLTDPTPHSTTSANAFQQGKRSRNARALPEHILCPEDECYRISTAEDHGRNCGQSTEQQCHGEFFGRPQSHPQLHSPTMLRDHLPSRDSFVPLALLEKKLEWRERIRHFTWTFFTMTMATGGIANVLYTGMSSCTKSTDLPRMLMDLCPFNSAFPFPRSHHHWHDLLPLQYCPFLIQYHHHIFALSPLPGDFQSVFLAPNGVAVRSC